MSVSTLSLSTATGTAVAGAPAGTIASAVVRSGRQRHPSGVKRPKCKPDRHPCHSGDGALEQPRHAGEPHDRPEQFDRLPMPLRPTDRDSVIGNNRLFPGPS